MITEYDRKLAQTLEGLSLPPVSEARKPPKRRFAYFIGFIALASAGVLAVALYQWPDAGPMPITAPVVAVTPNAGQAMPPAVPATGEITGSGFVTAPGMTAVFAQYGGRITDIAVQEGDAVTAGQSLVTLDDAGTRLALDQASAAQVAAKLAHEARIIDLDQARVELDRAETLATRGAISRESRDQAEITLARASNAEAQARQELARAALNIQAAQDAVDELTIRAPVAGVVTQLGAHIGDMVLSRADSIGESGLLTITDTNNLMIEADVAETSIADLRPGLIGEAVLDGFPDQPFAVTVQRLAPVLSAAKGTITLHLSLTDPPEGIRPNMAARIRIPLTETSKGNIQ